MLKGYQDHYEISDDKRLLLGHYRFDSESNQSIQFFDVQHQYPNIPIAVVELKIESNSGNKVFTCLYKFRVHGTIFKGSLGVSAGDDQNEQSMVDKMSLTPAN